MHNLVEKQIELEKKMTQTAIDSYRNELEKNKQKGNFSNTKVATTLIERIINPYTEAIRDYLRETGEGQPTRNTLAAKVISRLGAEKAAYISLKVILNNLSLNTVIQSTYKAIGQGLEDEWKMETFKDENKHYYQAIQDDLNKRNANSRRKKNITTGVFNKRLEFHLDSWTVTEKIQTGMVLTELFIASTKLAYYHLLYRKGRKIRYLQATEALMKWIENMNNKLELLNPFYLPMICPPKDWVGVFEGGYISPYIRRNKLIKNDNREYLRRLDTADMPQVYKAINTIQATAWEINNEVLDVVLDLWEEGKAIAELPDREDIPLTEFPYPDRGKASEESWTEEEIEVIKKWKRETYETHKTNVKTRSIRVLTAQILRIAKQFRDYEKIWFPYRMDFRGRMYPIPVLLQPQGSDLAKGLLRFAEGKRITDETAKRWFFIHGANVYGYDKGSYQERFDWVLEHSEKLISYGEHPLQDRGWASADKPFQFLAWCMEYSKYIKHPDTFTTHIPIQLDGTCNGLQHYSALLRDKVGGRAVNLINSEKPNDIYATVAERLEEKLNEILRRNAHMATNGTYSDVDRSLASRWLAFGINRKLTKRPVMVLPYGGTRMSCKEYVAEYLTDTYSPTEIWQGFQVGENPTDCIFKVSNWLAKYLWEAITETVQSAIVGMDYLRGLIRQVNKKQNYVEWFSPCGLFIHQQYPEKNRRQIETELFGKIKKVRIIDVKEGTDKQRQVNGICPNLIHSLDASCLMLWLNKMADEGITTFLSVHDCYGVLAPDTELSAKLLREAFVEMYKLPILDNFTEDVIIHSGAEDIPEKPQQGSLEIEEVLKSNYFFN